MKMDAVKAWVSDWQHVVLVVVGLVCATLAAIFVPTERWEKLGHYLADPATAATFSGLGLVAVGLYRRARGLPPALLVLALLGVSSLVGCGGSLTDSQRAALAVRTQLCLVQERAIVDDPCGDLAPDACEARDRAALAASRAECDADRAAIVGGQ